ncbi:hypothetical protein M2475_002274 [Breznakia sp. PF5-3]|uniref:DUF349 domain-containing protein n=1 Tax=unclassified Breznakia TaxID=2623764 RepID=UPI0024064B9A|nr:MULTISPECIES: DUF349 domain-containing protein [unclassified Breznakia]MDF9825891.1 hypothetical protein [Breznakia sp. PM6-1]MDF9836688.1 hypothetical protein [Breznakia sp. PF5-3]MDF9838968.1 hypothetical protein [Breznakia sp. PFB2-8]MDF9860982.1 hypothetical protein [Breznakia sp. PH5-24]
MMNYVTKKMEEILSLEQTNAEKKRLIIDAIYEIMKDNEQLYSEAKETIANAWEQLKGDEVPGHINVQLDNEYRQALRNFNKHLERAEFQREGKQQKEELLKEIAELKETNDWKDITKVLYELKDDWEEAAYAGQDVDADLNRQFKDAFNEVFEAKEKYYDDLHANRRSAKEVKEELIKKAQEASGSTRWKETSKLMRELMDEWKAAGNAGREDNDLLWEQFNEARQIFFQNQDKYFDEMEVRQAESLKIKEELIKEAEAICDSEDFKETAAQMRELMDRWKKAGSAGRDKEDALWGQFQQAREKFYSRQNEYYEQKKGKFKDNLYDGIKRRNKQVSDLETINKDLETQIIEIRNQEPVMGNQEDRWEITNQRNQEITKLQGYIDENLKKIADLNEQLKEMNEKYKTLED